MQYVTLTVEHLHTSHTGSDYQQWWLRKEGWQGCKQQMLGTPQDLLLERTKHWVGLFVL